MKPYSNIAGLSSFVLLLSYNVIYFIYITYNIYVTNPTIYCYNYYFTCLLKKLTKENYIFVVCYSFLIYHFWVPSFVAVDLRYHVIKFLYSNTTLIPPTSFVLLLSDIFLYYRPNIPIIYILYNCFLNQLKKEYALILSFIITFAIFF